MANRREKSRSSDRFYFLGFQTNCSVFSHKTKSCLPLGRKDMTTLDNILKSKDITFLTKVCIVKAVVFPVVMYKGERWTVKKAEHQRIDSLDLGAGEDS